MSVERVRNYLKEKGATEDITEFDVSSATVGLAAQALGCEEARIAKSLTFKLKDESVIMIVAAGDGKIDNGKYKSFFKEKARMLSHEEVEEKTGYKVGGVCPFAVKEGVKIYIDKSLLRFDYVYPAAGSSSSAIKITPARLFELSQAQGWTDICKEYCENE